jgi:hypothetical protein
MNSFAHKLVVNPWLNPNPIEFPWLERCEKDYETLKNTELPKRSSTSTVPQKIWDMQKIPAKPKTKEDFVPEKSIFELLAWYQPLHNHTLHDYGIYLTDTGIVKVAESLQLGLTEHNIRLTRRQLLFWAAHVLYLHELGHALIERLVYAMEANTEQYYSKAANTYHGFIFMEEALCNTFVCGMYPLVIEKYCPAEFSELNQHTHVMKDVLIDFMRKQPPGYCDFLPIPVPPHRSHGFIENIKALLLHIYEIQESSQEQGIRKLLNGVAAYIWTKSWPNLDKLNFESWPDQQSEPSATCPFDVMLQELLPWQTPVYVLDHAENEVWDISCMARTTVRWEKDWVLKNLENESLLTMINSNVMEKIKDIMEEGKITGSVYFGPGSLGDDTNKSLIDYLPEIDEIDGDFICADNGITSLTKIYEKIKSINGYADFSGNEIESHVLGLLKIKNLKEVIFQHPNHLKLCEVSCILNKHLQINNNIIISFQRVLIENDFDEYGVL